MTGHKSKSKTSVDNTLPAATLVLSIDWICRLILMDMCRSIYWSDRSVQRSVRLRGVSILSLSNILCMMLMSNCASYIAVSEIPLGLPFFAPLCLMQNCLDSMRLMVVVGMVVCHGFVHDCTLCPLNLMGILFVADGAKDIAMPQIAGRRLLFSALGIVQCLLTMLGLVYMFRLLLVPNSTRDVPMA